MRNKTYNKKKMLVVFLSALLMIFFLIARLVYLMIFDAAYYQQKAKTLHEREREIKAARGEIIDRNGKVLATNKAVCTISVIHSQITDPERVIQVLADELGIEKEMIRKRIEKVSSREKIKTNVEKETGDRIRAYELDGVKVDEDFKRYYPYGNLASKVLGFTGGDNQGIIGLEVKYENYLKGVNGMILTTTDARGIELADTLEDRVEPVSGDTLQVSLDYNIQEYAQQAAEKVMEEKQADAVVILILNPKTGEIYACVNAPEFDLNAPFTLPEGTDAALNDEEKQAMLNQMWRNRSINDTYEPGSIFKVFTASAALEEGVVKEEDTFYCPGYKLVEDRRIRCARTTGHGSETFVQGVQNSCNPVFIDIGLRLGADRFYEYFKQFGWIMIVTCIGEIMKYYIPLPIPASIYGLVLMMTLLMTGVVKIEKVYQAGTFLIEIMSLMFIPAAVGIIESWDQLHRIIVPVSIITIITTFVVMIVSGKVTQYVLEKGAQDGESTRS